MNPWCLGGSGVGGAGWGVATRLMEPRLERKGSGMNLHSTLGAKRNHGIHMGKNVAYNLHLKYDGNFSEKIKFTVQYQEQLF